MTISCPNCGIAGNNFICKNHIINEGKQWLFAEIARLNVENYRLHEENQSLKSMWSKLQLDGVIDQMGRKLPLPDHHRDCSHRQNGWAMCTCEELKARDIESSNNLRKALAECLDEDLKD